MKAVIVFTIFVVALACNLALVESLTGGAVVTNILTDPHPYMAQIRSKTATEKRNSSGIIINTRWILGVASMIISPVNETTFAYLGHLLYNGGSNIFYFNKHVVDREVALIKTTLAIPFTDRIKASPLPLSGQQYALNRTTITGYGAFNGSSSFAPKRIETDFKIDYNSNHKTTITLDQMALLRETSPVCIDSTDVGSIVWAKFNTMSAVVGLILGDEMNKTCATNPANPVAKAIRLTKYLTIISSTTADLA